jgi:hypothetical protein
MKIFIDQLIKKINPNAEFAVIGSDINTCKIEWHNGTTPIPKDQILAILPQVELDMALDNLRAKRNKILADSDYIVLSDSPVADKSNWLTYRQSLRDITQGLSTVEQVQAVVFPVKL